MKRLLVVEDDKIVAADVRRALEHHFGPPRASTTFEALILKIDHAADVDAAWQLVRDRPRDEPYSVLISDVSMFDFEDLAALVWVARHRFPDLHALLISSHSANTLADLVYQVGAHGALEKPFTHERLAVAVRAWLIPSEAPPSAKKAGPLR